MNIRMAGVDHTKSGVEERERFTFTAASRAAALTDIRGRYAGIECVIIATCNRTELWLYMENGDCPDPDRLLRELKNIPSEECKNTFTSRGGIDAVEHLFNLACGLKSLITGENQILSQVKEAVEAARAAETPLPVMQRLFQSATACAKRVKTTTNITRADVSAASAALDFVNETGFNIKGASCLIIGGGVIGRLCAGLFAQAGADVTITLRQHKTGKTVLSNNVRVIDYDERYSRLPDYQIVISATVSPHHTISREEVSRSFDGLDEKKRIFLDLAMPRDIDPEIKKIKGVSLFDIDDISARNPARGGGRVNFDEIKKIISEDMAEFIKWYTFRANTGTIREIRNEAAADIAMRVKSVIKNCAPDKTAEETLCRAIEQSAGKVMDKVLFGLRDNLDSRLWDECFAALRKSYIAEMEDAKERA
ncbi:MAG: glutamyl-tRNA reductase [Spirochaetaceae bacterium]|jgi:glutamyl-tRNA reductase|nr:glutamyl-tRNA reductase [Spirochaetaceae bacterium]